MICELSPSGSEQLPVRISDPPCGTNTSTGSGQLGGRPFAGMPVTTIVTVSSSEWPSVSVARYRKVSVSPPKPTFGVYVAAPSGVPISDPWSGLSTSE
jgi:hypothetical protein